MSTWNLGINDVSEETQAFKNKLASKDSQCASLQSQLMKRDAELEEIKITLTETLQKLSHEADRALQLERDFNHCSEDLRNEKMNLQNSEASLNSAREQIKSEQLASRELEVVIETLSHRSDDFSSSKSKLEKEKGTLELRVKELELELRKLSQPPPSAIPRPGRPRSSSVNNFRVTGLEQELSDLRATLSRKDSELQTTNVKLSRTQTDLIKVENEKIATERRLQSQIRQLEDSLQEKGEEIESLREQLEGGGGGREEELLQRIEEDDTRIATLEMLVNDNREMKSMKMALDKAEQKLRAELKRVLEAETRQVELVQEKEEVLDELEDARKQIADLSSLVPEKESQIVQLSAREQELVVHLTSVESRIVELEAQLHIKSTPRPVRTVQKAETPVRHDEEAIATYIERLLAAIDRLRAERDNLRRDLQFLEMESKFTIEALEVQANGASSSNSSEVESLQTQLADYRSREARMTSQLRRLALTATAGGVVITHLNSQLEFSIAESLATQSRDMQTHLEHAIQDRNRIDAELTNVQSQLELSERSLAESRTKEQGLLSQVARFETKERERDEKNNVLRAAHRETEDILGLVSAQLASLTKSLEDVESERNSLNLQVTNLQSDLSSAKEELAHAEGRYSALQMQQLTSMSTSDVSRALRRQIEELEGRVMRRTEQIGIQQHDIKRMETNLRLQEERILEVTAELETLTAQKDTMVEDCADARDARDGAIKNAEALEIQVESLEVRVNDLDRARQSLEARLEELAREKEVEVTTLVVLVADATSQSRDAARRAEEAAVERATSEARLVTRASLAEENHTRAVENIETLRSEHQTVLHSLTEKTVALQSLRDFLQTSEEEKKRAVLALSVSRVDTARITRFLAASEESARLLRAKLAETERLLENNDLKQEIIHLRAQHEDNLTMLNAKLEQTAVDLQAAESRLKAAEAHQQRTLEESSRSAQVFEERVASLSDQVHAGEADRNRMQIEHLDEVHRLRGQIKATEDQVGESKQLRAELESLHENLVDKFTQLKEDHERHLTQSTERIQAASRKLENELADLVSQHASKVGDLQAQLEHAVEGSTHLQSQLQEEKDDRAKEQKAHDLFLQSERAQRAEAAESQLRQQLADTHGKLVKTSLALESLQSEKSSLQIETTNLEASIQRSLSLTRFLESQVKENENTIASVKDMLERTRVELSKSEQAGKSAEVNLTLQAAQHDQVVSSLRREVAGLRTNPNLEGVVAELEEKNREMEELLKSKCAEIEENDDRFIEMLKEKKKLTAKVENLNRKVLSLQNKVAAAKELPASASAPAVSASTSNIPSDPIPPLPPLPPIISSISILSSSHSVSGPSSLSRPKTPERRIIHPSAVFKAKTPEKRIPPTTTPVATLEAPLSAGKKRRVPDEFDDEIPPPQGVVADGRTGGAENGTPHLRRVLHNVHSGFTPIRSNRPTPTHASPLRRATTGTPLISDLTNSPRSASHSEKASKRSWLGKIRGKSTAPEGRPPLSVRSSVFERIPRDQA